MPDLKTLLSEISNEYKTGNILLSKEKLEDVGCVLKDRIVSYEEFESITLMGFSTENLEIVQKAISAYFCNLQNVVVDFKHGGHPAEQVISWKLTPDGHSEFRFNESFRRSNDNIRHMIITRWLACLHMCNSYDASILSTGTTYFNVGDWGNGIGLCFSDNLSTSQLVPDSSFLGTGGYKTARAIPLANAFPWPERRSIAFWRGASTGLSPRGLMNTPRVQLCQLAKTLEAKSLLDAKISQVVQAESEEVASLLRNSDLCSGYTPFTENIKYKFLVDIDGNTNSWPGLFQKFFIGSPVLKVESSSGYRQWYYSKLTPWHNYVPIRSDFSDLIDVIEFLIENDDIARRIGANGQSLALSMTMESEIQSALSIVEASFNKNKWGK